MARILIDARCLADLHSGGVARAARFWIKSCNTQHVAYNIDQKPSVILSEMSPVSEPQNLGISIKPDPSTSFHSAQDDKEKRDEYICVTTGWQPSPAVRTFCDQNNFHYFHLRLPNKLWTLFCFLHLASLSKSAEKKFGEIDLVLLPNLGFVGQLHKPYQILIHDLSFIIEPHWFNFRRRWWHKLMPVNQLIGDAKKIDCVSEQTKNDVLRLFKLDENKVNVILPMNFGLPDIQAVRPSWLPASIQRFILLLGGSDPRKNIRTVLKAVAVYNGEHPTMPLVPVVLGGQVKFKLNQCPLSYFRAPEDVNDSELKFLYQNCVALLYPSWYEGFGLPLHEAYRLGTRIISSTAGALPETAPPNTIFCHPAKPHEWLIALEMVLKTWNLD